MTVAPKARMNTHSAAASRTQLVAAHRAPRAHQLGLVDQRLEAPGELADEAGRGLLLDERDLPEHRPQHPLGLVGPLHQQEHETAGRGEQDHEDDGGGAVDGAEAVQRDGHQERQPQHQVQDDRRTEADRGQAEPGRGR